MNILSPFLSNNHSCTETLRWLNDALSQSDLRVIQTFDLHNVRLRLEDCLCPYHGTKKCDCQMIVLLVYGKAIEPATLILHGHDERTRISFANPPLHHIDPKLRSAIEQALQLHPIK